MSSYNMEFSVVPPELAPEIPEAKGHKESAIRTALKELPPGGFMFIKGRDPQVRKRVSDMCSRISKLTKTKSFVIRLYEADGDEGIGIWRTDVDPRYAKKVISTEIPWPSKDKMMAGK